MDETRGYVCEKTHGQLVTCFTLRPSASPSARRMRESERPHVNHVNFHGGPCAPHFPVNAAVRIASAMDHFRTTWWLLALLALLLSGPMLTLAFGRVSVSGDWRTATHRATGLAPNPSTH